MLKAMATRLNVILRSNPAEPCIPRRSAFLPYPGECLVRAHKVVIFLEDCPSFIRKDVVDEPLCEGTIGGKA